MSKFEARATIQRSYTFHISTFMLSNGKSMVPSLVSTEHYSNMYISVKMYHFDITDKGCMEMCSRFDFISFGL